MTHTCGDGVKDARDHQVLQRVLVEAGLDANADGYADWRGQRKYCSHERERPPAEVGLRRGGGCQQSGP